jgi:hypothetical protein
MPRRDDKPEPADEPQDDGGGPPDQEPVTDEGGEIERQPGEGVVHPEVYVELLDHPDARQVAPEVEVAAGDFRGAVTCRLGRHVEHDPRSRNFAVAEEGEIHSVEWARHAAPFNQGNLGSCTGNAMAGLLMTEPFYEPGRNFDEAVAVALYEKATRLDRFKGYYPPSDTGSSGLAVAKAAREAGWIGAYRHAFSVHALKVALMAGPVIVGTVWTEGMFEPDAEGVLHMTGNVAGGHEYEILGWDEESKHFKMCNSWGPWGPLSGYALIAETTMGQLLAQRGDVTQPFEVGV